jgi:hypothetical protein
LFGEFECSSERKRGGREGGRERRRERERTKGYGRAAGMYSDFPIILVQMQKREKRDQRG